MQALKESALQLLAVLITLVTPILLAQLHKLLKLKSTDIKTQLIDAIVQDAINLAEEQTQKAFKAGEGLPSSTMKKIVALNFAQKELDTKGIESTNLNQLVDAKLFGMRSDSHNSLIMGVKTVPSKEHASSN